MCYMMMMVAISSWDLFNVNESRVEGNPSVDSEIGVREMLGNM